LILKLVKIKNNFKSKSISYILEKETLDLKRTFFTL